MNDFISQILRGNIIKKMIALGKNIADQFQKKLHADLGQDLS